MESVVQEKLSDVVIEKIQKLLALARNNPSQQEAINAAKKAHELMAKYNLTQVDVKLEKEDLKEALCCVGTGKSWKYDLANVVATNFCTKAYFIGSHTIVFYGRSHDIQMAQDVYIFLFRTCEKLAQREYRKRKGEKRIYYWYTRGFINGVENGLSEQCRALMVITPQEVEDGYAAMSKNFKMKTLSSSEVNYLEAIKKTLKGLKQIKSLRAIYSAYDTGFYDGKSTVSIKNLENERSVNK